jgi:CheY-like chemotaxis protein
MPDLQPVAHPAALPRAALAGHVAVVDDEAPVALFMHDLLAHWGLAVTTFADARAALGALAESAAFDIVITDHTMPGMTGLDLARAARALRPGLPVLMFTGYGEGITAEAMERAGVAALLRKPIDPAALLAALEGRLPRVPAAR